MKSYTEYLWFNTPERFQIINITDKVQEIVTKSKIKEGFALVSAMHTSSSVYVSDDESGLNYVTHLVGLTFLEKLKLQ